MEFEKFALKSDSWLKPGNYKVFDNQGLLAYQVKSNIWKFKKEFFLTSESDDIVYKISAKSAMNTSYNLYDKDELIAQIDKPFSWASHRIEINTIEDTPWVVKGNIWGNEFRFFRDEDEFAFVSYKIWSSGELGVAISQGESVPLILSVVIIIAFLKQSGMA